MLITLKYIFYLTYCHTPAILTKKRLLITVSAKTLLFGIDLYVKTVKVNASIYSLLL